MLAHEIALFGGSVNWIGRLATLATLGAASGAAAQTSIHDGYPLRTVHEAVERALATQ